MNRQNSKSTRTPNFMTQNIHLAQNMGPQEREQMLT